MNWDDPVKPLSWDEFIASGLEAHGRPDTILMSVETELALNREMARRFHPSFCRARICVAARPEPSAPRAGTTGCP